jgi:hypothetical protein
LPKPAVEKIGLQERPGYRVETLLLALGGDTGKPNAAPISLHPRAPTEGWSLPEGEGTLTVMPALEFLPDQPAAGPAVLYVHDQGKAADAGPGGAIEQLVRQGRRVLAVDLRGTGQTKSASADNDVGTAYLLGRSYVGLRAEDVLLAARYLAEQSPAGHPQAAAPGAVRLVAVGQVGIPALHAAALEPGLFQSVKLARTLRSWSEVIANPLTRVEPDQIVHAALETYDLPDLAGLLGDKLAVEAPSGGG